MQVATGQAAAAAALAEKRERGAAIMRMVRAAWAHPMCGAMVS